jgi:hypothetical protein
MHRQVNSLLSNGGSPGKLAEYTRKLADRGVNIRAIGGAEWGGRGAVAVLVDENTNEAELADWLGTEGYPSRPIVAVEAVLDDRPGALAEACEKIGKVNIASILVVDTHLGYGLVTFGFESEGDAAKARQALRGIATEPHKLTEAWQAHDDWDRSNPDPPDPRRFRSGAV